MDDIGLTDNDREAVIQVAKAWLTSSANRHASATYHVNISPAQSCPLPLVLVDAHCLKLPVEQSEGAEVPVDDAGEVDSKELLRYSRVLEVNKDTLQVEGVLAGRDMHAFERIRKLLETESRTAELQEQVKEMEKARLAGDQESADGDVDADVDADTSAAT